MSSSKDTLPITPKTRSVLTLAAREAGRLRHDEIRLCHLALAIIRHGTCFACQLFRSWHVDLDSLADELEEAAGPRDPGRPLEDIPFSDEVTRFLIEVNNLRHSCGQEWVGTDHFLLVLTSQEGHAVARILARHGILASSVMRVFREAVAEPSDAVFPEADLVQVLARRGLFDVAEAVIQRDVGEGDNLLGIREACLSVGLDEEAFLDILSNDLGYPRLRPADTLDDDLVTGFPGLYARKYRTFPLRREEGRLLLVCDDPFREDLQHLEAEFATSIGWVVAPSDLVDEILDRFYEA